MKPRDKEILKATPCQRLETKVLQVGWKNTREELKEPLAMLGGIIGDNYGYTDHGRYIRLKDAITTLKQEAMLENNKPVVRLMENFENYIRRIERQEAEK